MARTGVLLAAAAMLLAGSMGVNATVKAQPTQSLPPPNRVGPNESVSWHALVNATVHVNPRLTIEHATVVMRDGVITDVLAGAKDAKDAPPAPAGARTWDCTGLHVYAGFVEPYLEVDAPRPEPDLKGAHWSARVMPQRRVLDGKGADEATAKQMRSMGYVAAVISPRGGVFRGQSAAVSLATQDADAASPRTLVYADSVYQSIAMETGGGGGGGPGGGAGAAADPGRWPSYPNSQMGAIAMIRQVLAEAQSKPANALAALNTQTAAPMVMNADDELEVVRMHAVAREFGRKAVVLGSGMEFRRLESIVAANRESADESGVSALLLPLNYPEKPKIGSVAESEELSLRELMSWEQAPTNPRRVLAAGVPAALTTAKLRDRTRFTANVREAIRHGLSEEQALAALTTTPADMMGLGAQLGTIEKGKRASVVVADGPIFGKKTKLRDVWIDGQRHEINAAPVKAEGFFAITLDPAPPNAAKRGMAIDKDNGVTMKMWAMDEQGAVGKEQRSKPKATTVTEDRFSVVFDHEPFGMPGMFTMSGIVERDEAGKISGFSGTGIRADGSTFRWSASRTDEPKPTKEEKKPDDKTKPDAKPEEKKDDKPAEKKADDKADEKKPDAPATDAPKAKHADAVSGTWSCSAFGQDVPGGNVPFSLVLKLGDGGAVTGSAKAALGGGDLTGTFDAAASMLKVVVTHEVTGEKAHLELKIDGEKLTGSVRVRDAEGAITGERSAPAVADKKDDDKEEPADAPDDLGGLPFGAYAMKESPKPQRVVFRNATVWTSGPQGIIENGEVEIDSGKIVYVGAARPLPAGPLPPGMTVVECKGKHLTPGIIDCHSHTGISRGVNESGQAITAEVRIQDVTNPDAINWYRQLAGGVTAVNNLHGSANAIGGQSQVNKLRWGCVNADDMHDTKAVPGIKFALGENPKGGNGDGRATRYPQTRMGVETIIRDRFIAAREYAEAMKPYDDAVANIRRTKIAPQEQQRRIAELKRPRVRDLELETLAEVLAGTRLVHCHSYRQDEILMLARVAQEYKFQIGTYQHILEGYKVADLIRQSSIGASGFSDWWAYKVEVQDAIPAGFPIMFEQGVIVSYNSDSDEMARRLNLEASKGVKYSALPDGKRTVSNEECFKWVTINPAKQLKIDGHTGSLEAGKDADLVVWSGDPLSSYTKAEQTWVDGTLRFSLEMDKSMRERNAKERARLIQKVLRDPPKKPDAKPGETPAADPAAPGGRPGGRRRPTNMLTLSDLEREMSEDGVQATLDSVNLTDAAAAANAMRSGEPKTLLQKMLRDAQVYRRETNLELIRRGINPEDARAGECGCGR